MATGLEVREHPILFSPPMVHAIHDGMKTQTRRLLKSKWLDIVTIPGRGGRLYNRYREFRTEDGERYECGSGPVCAQYPRDACPYGLAGDRLWVRETHYRHGRWIKNGLTRTGKQAWKFQPTKHADGEDLRHFENPPKIIRPNRYRRGGWYKRPSIFMPRWASRTTLEITDVRVERINHICYDDMLAEGILDFGGGEMAVTAEWIDLWESIHGKKEGRTWLDNPWVWVVSFRRVT